MKLKFRNIFYIVFISIMIITVLGCTIKNDMESQKVNNESNIQLKNLINKNNQNEKKPMQKAYSKELSEYFPLKENTEFTYSGIMEYGHILKLRKVIYNNNFLKLSFRGEIIDISEGEGPQKKDLQFETEYLINEDSVVEVIKNKKLKPSQSIMREHIILKLPITEGEAWKEQFSIGEKEYEVETKIIETYIDKNNRKKVKTQTQIKGLEKYEENTYKEIRIFEEGKGMVEFIKKLPMIETSKGKESMGFDFQYHLFESENK